VKEKVELAPDLIGTCAGRGCGSLCHDVNGWKLDLNDEMVGWLVEYQMHCREIVWRMDRVC